MNEANHQVRYQNLYSLDKWKVCASSSLHNSLYNTVKDLQLVKSVLVSNFRAVTEWFYENFVILNPNKYQYMCIGKST